MWSTGPLGRVGLTRRVDLGAWIGCATSGVRTWMRGLGCGEFGALRCSLRSAVMLILMAILLFNTTWKVCLMTEPWYVYGVYMLWYSLEAAAAAAAEQALLGE